VYQLRTPVVVTEQRVLYQLRTPVVVTEQRVLYQLRTPVVVTEQRVSTQSDALGMSVGCGYVFICKV